MASSFRCNRGTQAGPFAVNRGQTVTLTVINASATSAVANLSYAAEPVVQVTPYTAWPMGQATPSSSFSDVAVRAMKVQINAVACDAVLNISDPDNRSVDPQVDWMSQFSSTQIAAISTAVASVSSISTSVVASITSITASLNQMTTYAAAQTVDSPWTRIMVGNTSFTPMGHNVHRIGSDAAHVNSAFQNWGSRLVRCTLNWNEVETSASGYVFPSDVDAIIGAATTNGMTPTIQIKTWDATVGNLTPTFYNSLTTGSTATRTAFQNFCSTASFHYKSLGAHWYEIENEPDLVGEYSIGNLLLAVSSGTLGLHRGDANSTSFGPGFAGLMNVVTAAYFAQAGVDQSCDAIATHFYFSPSVGGSNTPPGDSWGALQAVITSTRTLISNTSKSIYISETGWTDLDSYGKSGTLAQYAALLRGMSNIIGFAYYAQYDDGAGALSWGLQVTGTDALKSRTYGYKAMLRHTHWASTYGAIFTSPDAKQAVANDTSGRGRFQAVLLNNGTSYRLALWAPDTTATFTAMTSIAGITVSSAAAGNLNCDVIQDGADPSTTVYTLQQGLNFLPLTITYNPTVLYSTTVTAILFPQFRLSSFN